MGRKCNYCETLTRRLHKPKGKNRKTMDNRESEGTRERIKGTVYYSDEKRYGDDVETKGEREMSKNGYRNGEIKKCCEMKENVAVDECMR